METNLDIERRTHRSADPLEALHHQLHSLKQKTEVQILVVSDSSGNLLAGIGSLAQCEELAALGPLHFFEPKLEWETSPCFLARIPFAPSDLFLCGADPEKRKEKGDYDRDLEAGAQGIVRILSPHLA